MDRRKLANGRMAFIARYWTGLHGNFAIVAVLNPGVDWAAYIGGMKASRAKCIQDVIDFGAKLSEEDAMKFFGEIENILSVSAPLGYRK